MNEDLYFQYLLSIIDSPLVDNHRAVLDILYRTNFRWSVRNDDNRVYDAMDIRYNFGAECNVPDDYMQELMLIPCSVIEIVVGLAIRMDDIMRDPKESHVNRWFWEMIGNLGLLEFTDDECLKGVWSLEDVLKILGIFMDRTYDELGHGGLFPRKVCYKNQNDIELFAQMNGYLNEFYCS